MTGVASWDERHAARGPGGEPARFVVEASQRLVPRAAVLDVAGGTGRNSVWLAAAGFDVTLVDFSPVAASLAAEAARGSGVALRVRVIDVAQERLPPGPRNGRWEGIVIHHFLDRGVLDAAPDALAPGGVLVFCQPTVRNLERHERPSRRWLLAQGELATWTARYEERLEILELREGWFEGRHEARLVARRLGEESPEPGGAGFES